MEAKISFYIESNSVMRREDYLDGSFITMMVGLVNKTETNRIDAETVEDITYQFVISEDGESGEYVEQSRTTRNELEPPKPQSLEDVVTELQTKNADLQAQNAQIMLALVANDLI